NVSLEGSRVRVRTVRRLGAIVLAEVAAGGVSDEDTARAVLDAIERDGVAVLPWREGAHSLRERLVFLHAHDDARPDTSEAARPRGHSVRAGPVSPHAHDDAGPDTRVAALASTAQEWLVPFLAGSNGDLSRIDLAAALLARVDARLQARLDTLAPTHMEVPSGSRLRIDYTDPAAPVLAARLQELFGWTETPRIAGGRVPLTIHLLSPAQRPVQVTRDLASF